MGGELPKVLAPLAGRPIVDHLIDTIRAAKVDDINLVIGHGAEQVRGALGERFGYALQREQLGMAHAVACARELILAKRPPVEQLVVTVGDSPLLRPQTLRGLLALHEDSGAACSFLSARYEEPPRYARVLRDDRGRVLRCVEQHACNDEQLGVRELLTSHYVFDADALWRHLDAVRPWPGTGERYLTDITGVFSEHGLRMQALPVEDPGELTGLNTPQELAWAEARLAARRG